MNRKESEVPMKLLFCIVLILAIIVTPLPTFAADDTVEKTDCKLAIGYDSMDELKADLLLSAKRLAVNELFGELITSATAVEDFVVTSDQIRASSLGLVREDGIKYFNSDNFGELCITITVYTTDEDRQQFEPFKLNKRNCVSDSDLSAKELRKFAEEEAIVKAVTEYNRKLEGQDRDKLLGLLQRVTYSESAMLPDTDTYCAHVEGEIIPIEAIALLQSEPAQESAEETASTYDDEFDGSTLNPNWYWLKEDPSRWSLDKVPGKLQIIATGGDFAFACSNYQNILLQPAPSGDFEIETKVIIRPTQNYQLGGLIVFNDPDNWVKLNVLWSDSIKELGNPTGEGIEILSEQNGKFVPDWPWPVAHFKLDNDGIFLRISKHGNSFKASYSFDSEDWIHLGSLTVSNILKPQIGIFATSGVTSVNNPPNCTYTAPDIPVEFDFFRVNQVDPTQINNQKQPTSIRWITSQPTSSCDNICSKANLVAISPGSNQDGTFYVCRIHEDNRSGFNIPMADIWDQCLVGYGGIERIDDQFDCLCAEQ